MTTSGYSGYCEIMRDEEGTVTLPWVWERKQPPVRYCLNEGCMTIDGWRVCVGHMIVGIELQLMLDNHAEVRYIDVS